MTGFQFNAEVRTKTGKGDARRLRMAGKIPAVIYGKGVDPIHCILDRRDLDKALRTLPRNTIIKLAFAGNASPEREVIVRDYQKHPLSHQYTHVDFQAIDRKQPLQIEVEINFVGTPVGKKSGAIFTTLNKTVRIQCLPDKIPEKIDLDVTPLDAGESLHVSDLQDTGFKILSNPQVTLCQMSMIKEEVAAPVPGAAAPGEAAAEPAAADKGAAAKPAAAKPAAKS